MTGNIIGSNIYNVLLVLGLSALIVPLVVQRKLVQWDVPVMIGASLALLVFAGDGGGNIVAHDAATGKPLWHSKIGDVTNPPQTYLIDGRQHLLVAAGGRLFAFVLY